MLDELQRFTRLILVSAALVILLGCIFFSLGARTTHLGPVPFLVPTTEAPSIAVRFFQMVVGDLLPKQVSLLSRSPISGFFIQVDISLFLSFLLLFPFLLVRFVMYLLPALQKKEQRTLLFVTIPSFVLFATGVAFGYFVVTPLSLGALVKQVSTLGLPQIFFIDDFVTTVCILIGLSAFVFLIPVFLPLTTYLGLVSSQFWFDHWRLFIFLSLVVSAMLSSDGTGITMLLLAAPIGLCYFVGMGISRYIEKRSRSADL